MPYHNTARFSHLNGTITNQIVTGVEMHEEIGVCWGGGGKLKPLPEKLFFISALTERFTFVTSLKGLLN